MKKPDALFQRLDYSIGISDNKNITLLCPEIFAVQALESVKL